MFASIDDKHNSRMFRLSAVFKDEEVDPDRLKEAVRLVMPRFPAFNCRDRKGFFWAYLEKADGLPVVKKEEYFPAALRRLGSGNKPEIEFLYYKRRISVEANHVLGDGMGVLEIMKSVLAQYMILGGADKSEFTGIRFGDSLPTAEEYENPYDRFHNDEKLGKIHREKAYVIPKCYEDNYQNYINGLIDIAELKKVCREKNITITELVSAVLISSIIKSDKTPINDTVIIEVPCNIRKFFPTETVRNFASSVPVQFSPKGRRDYSLDEIIEGIRGQLKNNDSKEVHQEFINANCALTQNKILQPVPYFIKKLVVNGRQKKSHNTEQTILFSNIGNVVLPEIMHEKIQRLDVAAGDSRVYDMSMFCSAISFNGYMNLSFSLTGKDHSIPISFFRSLTEMNIPVRVESTLGNGIEEKTEIAPKHCEECKVRLGEEYSVCPLCDAKAKAYEKEDMYFSTALYPVTFKRDIPPYVDKKNRSLSAEKLKAYFILQP